MERIIYFSKKLLLFSKRKETVIMWGLRKPKNLPNQLKR